MKILIFSPYYPPHIGGLETHSDEFNKYLSQEGIDITVFTTRLPEESPEKEIRHNNVKISRFPAFEIIPNYPLPRIWEIKFWKIFLGLFKNKYDIVISRTRFFNTSLMAMAYAKLKRVKWFHIEHGSDFVKLNNKMTSLTARIYDHSFGKLILKLSDKNIANSMASADFCRKIIKNKNCEVIYRGVEIAQIEGIPPALELKDRYPGDVIITFIGRLIDGKGVADLLNAAINLKGNFKLFIIGEGPQRSKLGKLAGNSAIRNHIIFLGSKKFEEAIGILKITDISVNPSYTEGLPTSVIEAGLCKKAIIATNVGGTPEIITDGKSGYLIHPGDIKALEGKLQLLIDNDELRRTFGENAYFEVRNKFSWDRSIDAYLKIFNSPRGHQHKWRLVK